MLDTILLALIHSAFVGVMSCLISESNVAAPIRDFFGWKLLFCPICLGFWFAFPFLWFGILHYFLVVAISNAWMLIILHTYEALDRTNEVE